MPLLTPLFGSSNTGADFTQVSRVSEIHFLVGLPLAFFEPN